MYIFIGIALLILAGAILYPKAKTSLSIKLEKQELQKINEQLSKENVHLELQGKELSNQVFNKEQELNHLRWQIEEVEKNKRERFELLKEAYSANLEMCLKALSDNYQLKEETIISNYELAAQEAQNEYLNTLEDEKEKFILEKNIIIKTIEELREQLKGEQDLVETAIAARKRQEEEETQKEFYRLQISNSDLEDIEKLNNVASLLNTPEVLYKTIWKVYYEKPYNDLVGRVLGKNPITGIYRITNINNGKSYIGQSTNIQDRWRQHIKRGCRAEAPTRNKLYPAMLEEGVHNFYFELLEECPKEKLDSQEDYWQSFYQTTSYGYSIK